MKWLIVTGDDFGMTSGINRGIVQAHRNGILTSASLMVDRPASEEAASLGRECPALSLGLHLELDAIDPGRVLAEFDRQCARFLELVGTAPTHVDSHHDVHRDPHVLPHVLAWARWAGVPVRGYSRVYQLSQFYGQWDGLTHPEQIGVDVLVRLLETQVRTGVTELTCHPGYVDAELSSSYAAEREVEIGTLCDNRARQAIVDREIRVIGFRDLSALATSPGEKALT